MLEEGAALGGPNDFGRLELFRYELWSEKELLTRGIFAEFYEEMGNAFDLNEAKQYFWHWFKKEEKIDLKLETAFLAPVMQADHRRSKGKGKRENPRILWGTPY